MLILHQLSYVLSMLRLTFYAFSRSNILKKMLQCQFLFFAVFGFRKATQEIFSELDVAKAKVPIFTVPKQKSEGELKRSTRLATPCLGAAYPWPAPRVGVATLAPVFDSSSVLRFGTVKIGTLVFVTSNSENISCLTFLK